MSQVIPIILAGGVGMRLWPLSRKYYPKQFLRLMGKYSLLQDTVFRVADLSFDKTLPVIGCYQGHYQLCVEHMREIGQLSPHFIIEPCLRNTLPAISASVLYAMSQYGEDAILLILPSDHKIGNHRAFESACRKAIQVAQDCECLVVFGVKPDSPHTGYGYIHRGVPFHDQAYKVASFREKPNKELAEYFLNDGGYFWNSGMFVFSATAFVNELKTYAMDTYTAIKKSIEKGELNNHCLCLDELEFARCKNESIDYAVMEKTNKAVMLPVDIDWNDLGCWDAVAVHNKGDADNNVIVGDVKMHDTSNCYLHSQDKHLSTVGLHNHIVINTKDSVLVAHRNFSEKVRDLVRGLQLSHQSITTTHLQVNCPWGCHETLLLMEGIRIRLLTIHPGSALALQSHQYRDEHWVVIEGEALVVCDDKEVHLSVSHTINIPKLSKHQLTNYSNQQSLRVIEIQFGSRLDESDVVYYNESDSKLSMAQAL